VIPSTIAIFRPSPGPPPWKAPVPRLLRGSPLFFLRFSHRHFNGLHPESFIRVKETTDGQ